jgi:hypothetical protein
VIEFHEIERLEGLTCKLMQAVVHLRKADVPQRQTAAEDQIRMQAKKILAIVGEQPPGSSA